MTERDLLTRSSFALTSETREEGEFVSLWGRAAVSSFRGREDALWLTGEVTSGMLGGYWNSERWSAGLIVSHSVGDGDYSGTGSGGRVEATLTGAYPWARLALSDRVEAWGAAGYGAGDLTVTPRKAGTEGNGGGDDAALRADLALWMAAAGLRGTLLDGGDDGVTLAAKTDAMTVQTSSGGGRGADGGGLTPARATVTRLRLGLEASRPVTLGGAVLTPSLEAVLRRRGLVSHESRGFRERGFFGSFSWNQKPCTDRGATLTLTQTRRCRS